MQLPISFDPFAGFPHAMHGSRDPVRVQRDDHLQMALDYWNARAGWELLTFTDHDVEVIYNPDDRLALCTWSSPAPYTSATVSGMPFYLVHEIGHALGFAHLPCGVMETGMMEELANHDFDRAILLQVGYAS